MLFFCYLLLSVDACPAQGLMHSPHIPSCFHVHASCLHSCASWSWAVSHAVLCTATTHRSHAPAAELLAGKPAGCMTAPTYMVPTQGHAAVLLVYAGSDTYAVRQLVGCLCKRVGSDTYSSWRCSRFEAGCGESASPSVAASMRSQGFVCGRVSFGVNRLGVCQTASVWGHCKSGWLHLHRAVHRVCCLPGHAYTCCSDAVSIGSLCLTEAVNKALPVGTVFGTNLQPC